jgi:His-Xaa-Ser system protein HxsD
MKEYKQISSISIEFTVDTRIFNDNVISKTLYWLGGDFNIYQEYSCNLLSIKLEKKEGYIDEGSFLFLRSKINQDLIDFKTRDIVNQETKNIRQILLIKAFANNDDFDDYNLIANND